MQMSLTEQIAYLFVLALPIASVAWTVTHEEVFREPREWCVRKSERCPRLYARKFFYLFTCEYFSHYVTAVFLFFTRFTLLLPGWRGYVIAGFALVWIANTYELVWKARLDIKHERVRLPRRNERRNGPAAFFQPVVKPASPDVVARTPRW